MKSQERRVADAIAEARRLIVGSTFQATEGGEPVSLEEVVAYLIEAADKEPCWPSDEVMGDISLTFSPSSSFSESARASVADALKADPIVQAAIALRNRAEGMGYPQAIQGVVDAVNEAGL